MLVELAARAAALPRETGVELIFTVAEEDGLRGAKEVDLGALRAPLRVRPRPRTPIGEVITAAPTYQRIVAEFEGVEAHAGIRPEDGRSAIVAAAAAIERMKLGRLDEETTTNVGLIAGGIASNVVAGACRSSARRARSTSARLATATAAMIDACTWAASERGVDVDVDVDRGLPRLSPGLELAGRVVSHGRRWSAGGIQPARSRPAVARDANACSRAGYDAVLLANGTDRQPHARRERRRVPAT